MSLRTYPLIVHPAYIEHVASTKFDNPPHCKTITSCTPHLERAVDIAAYLDVGPDIVLSILRRKYRHYRRFQFRKRDGTVRHIHAPRTFLKVVQWWILDTILSNVDTHEAAYGFIKGRSFIDNARRHVGANYLLNVDVSNFFGSIQTTSVYPLFIKLGYSPSVSAELTEIVSYAGFLPQGAPTSPYISNIIMHPIDNSLQEYSRRLGITYTRYADDMSFSSEERIPVEIIDTVSAEIARIGLRLNLSKTRFMGKNQQKEVTGIVIARDGIALSREYLNAARSLFYRSLRFPDFYKQNKNQIMGTYNLIKQVSGRGSLPILRLADQFLSKDDKISDFRLI